MMEKAPPPLAGRLSLVAASSTLLLDGRGLSEPLEWRIFALWLAANR